LLSKEKIIENFKIKYAKNSNMQSKERAYYK